jgi:hypothetical protein
MKKYPLNADQPELTFFRVMSNQGELPEGATLLEIVRTWQHQRIPLTIEECVATDEPAPSAVEDEVKSRKANAQQQNQSPTDFKLPF